jgi:RNA polymerase sigma-70 factor (ECF subfamily)
MLEDRILVWKIKGGNRDALRQVYEKYKDDILTIAQSMTNDKSEAEDILGDVFISFARAAKYFHFYKSLKNYLISCAVDKTRDRYGTKMYRIVELERLGRIESDSEIPERPASADEEPEIINNALAKIPPQQREAVILHLQAGLNFGQIARIQGTATNTVQARYYYGIEKLRFILDRTIME